METVNHEYYVSLEVAKLLKEAGFDWECNRFYDCTNSDCIRYEEYSAPTLEVAQRWLREVKKAHVICDLSSIGEPPGYSFNVFHFVFDNRGCYKIDENYQCTVYEWYPTYEEALETGIKKALEIILEKGE